MFSFIRWLLIAAFSLTLVLFAVVNRDAVTVSLYPLPYEIASPVYLFALIFFLFGYVMSYLLGGLRRVGKNTELRHCKQKIDALENELTGLRKSSSLT